MAPWHVLLLLGSPADVIATAKGLGFFVGGAESTAASVAGLDVADLYSGQLDGDGVLFTDFPLRTFEKEVGVQTPVGCWDPLGLGKDGNVETCLPRGPKDIRHGRFIYMVANQGCVASEVAGNFPGYFTLEGAGKFPGFKAEIADDRRAIMAIIGMFMIDGLKGSA